MRPQFHFTAHAGWINDPHGTTYRDGQYHHFFQYVPGGVEWSAGCHWGHAVGPDLLSLRELPVALAPGDGDDGIWTGALVADGFGSPTIFYTAVSEPKLGMGRIRTATPLDDEWLHWSKGPVVVPSPAPSASGAEVLHFRDPFLFPDVDGAGWWMLVGAGLAGGTAAALAYRSDDAVTWAPAGIAVSRPSAETDPVWTGAMWECPQLFEIDGRHVLLFSVWDDDLLHSVAYGIGRWADGRFAADTWGRLSYGPSYYAPSFFRDASGAPALVFWMRGVQDLDAAWVGAHSVPHRLRLDGERLVAEPHPDVERYRGAVSADGTVGGLAADVAWRPAGDDALVVRSGDDAALELRAGVGLLTAIAGADAAEMPYAGGPVRLILDGPAAEISTTDGTLGLAIAPAGATLAIQATDATVHPLERPRR